MLLFALNLMIVTALFFVAGMIKPKWPLFFLEKPSRFLISAITLVLVMISVTMYGEALKRQREERELTAKASVPKAETVAPVPVPVAPEPAKP